MTSTSTLRSLLSRCKEGPAAAPFGIYQQCYEAAASLRGQGVFSEVCPPDGAPRPTGPLGGMVMAVSDCLNVHGMPTTNGTKLSMLHHVPPADDPLIRLLRGKGVRFVGKLQSQAPLALQEAARWDACRSCAAFSNGAAHAAVLSSLGGPAGLAVATSGACCFHPTAGSLPSTTNNSNGNGNGTAKRKRSHLTSLKYNHGFVAPTVDDLKVLWDGIVEDGSLHEGADSANGGEGSSGSAGSSSAGAGTSSTRTDAAEEVVVDVGVPIECLAGLDKDRGGKTFIECMQRHLDSIRAQKKGKGNNVKLNFEEISLSPAHLETAVQSGIIMANYELAESMTETLELNGVLEELPELVPYIYAGRKTTKEQYQEAVGKVAEIHDHIDAELQEVDVVAVPLLCEPFRSGHLRSITFSLPFFLSGYPMISVGLPQTGSGSGVGPLLLVGEMGDERGLFSDAASFAEVATC